MDDGSDNIVIAAESGNNNAEISPLIDSSISRCIEKIPSKKKTCRLNSQQAQGKRVEDLKSAVRKKDIHKQATLLYADERAKEGGMSVRQVANKIRSENNGDGPSSSTIYKYVVDLKMIGVSPLKKGPEGKVSAMDYKSLCMAFERKLRIEQMNAKVCTRQTQIE